MPILFLAAMFVAITMPHIGLPLFAVLVVVWLATSGLEWLSFGGTEAVAKFLKQYWWLWLLFAVWTVAMIARHA